MTLRTIGASFQYPSPDIKKIKQSKADLDYRIGTLSTIYLPVLGEQLKSLSTEIYSVETQTLRVLTQPPAVLPTKSIQYFYTFIEKLKRDPSSPEQQEALDEFYDEINLLVESGRSEVLELAVTLNNRLKNLRAVTLSDNQFLIKELEASLDKAIPYITEAEDNIKKLEQGEAELKKAISLIEATDTFATIKEFFLTADKLSGLNLSAPQVELVKTGIGAAGKILNLIGDRISYDNLIEARRQVQQRLDNSRRNLASIRQDVKNLQNQEKQLIEFKSVQTLRETYTNEINTLVDAVDKFLEINQRGPAEDYDSFVKRFIEHSNIFIEHTNSLRREWRS